MKLLRVNENYEIVPQKDTLVLIPEFAPLFSLKYNIASGDNQGRKRERAKKELAFIYFAYDYRSEYADLDEDERIEQAKNAAGLPPKYKISEQLQTAIDKFIELQDTREIKLMRAAYHAVDKLRDYFEEVVVGDKNAKSLMDNLASLGKLLNSLKQVENNVKRAMKEGSRTRGDQTPGRLK